VRDSFLIFNTDGAVDTGAIVAGKAQHAQIAGRGRSERSGADMDTGAG
jgi:hypothetical protein